MDASAVDRLVAESERLRDDLLRTASRVVAFADDLMAAARALSADVAQTETEGGDDERRVHHS